MQPHEIDSRISVTRLGYFWKILAIIFLAKVGLTFGDFLGYFEKNSPF